jgi:hypothetical protein
MKHGSWFLAGLVAVAVGGWAAEAHAENKVEEYEKDKTWKVWVDAPLPKTVDEFRALRDQLCTTPQGAMVTFIVAGQVWGVDKDLGEQFMVCCLDPELLDETFKARKSAQRVNVDGWQLGGKVLAMLNSGSAQKSREYGGNTYVQGTKTEDGYKLPESGPYQYIVRSHNVPSKDPAIWKGLLVTSGAESNRPFEVKKIEEGKWRMMNSSSFFMGYQAPPEKPTKAGPR